MLSSAIVDRIRIPLRCCHIVVLAQYPFAQSVTFTILHAQRHYVLRVLYRSSTTQTVLSIDTLYYTAYKLQPLTTDPTPQQFINLFGGRAGRHSSAALALTKPGQENKTTLPPRESRARFRHHHALLPRSACPTHEHVKRLARTCV